MICVGGPLNGTILHSTREVFQCRHGKYLREKAQWTWVPE